MKKRKVWVVVALLVMLAVVAMVWFQVNRSSERQAFVDNMTGVVTDTLTFPWAQWSDITKNIDPARPETMRTALEDYFTAKYGDRLTQSAVKSLVDDALLMGAWNVWGEDNVEVKTIRIDEWLPKSKVCLFRVVLLTDNKEYTLLGRAQMASEGNDRLSYCSFSGDGFNEFIDAGHSYQLQR